MRDDLTLNTTRLGQELEVKKLYRAVVFNFPLNFPLDITLWEVSGKLSVKLVGSAAARRQSRYPFEKMWPLMLSRNQMCWGDLGR